MGADTTVRISHETREQLNTVARERGLTADEAVALGLRALRDQEWRRQAEREALEIARDQADRAEVAATLHYLGDE